MHEGHQLFQAGKVWRLKGIFQVLVQPDAQDEKEGTGGRWAGSRVRALAFLSTLPPSARLQGVGPGTAHSGTSPIPSPNLLWLSGQ